MGRFPGAALGWRGVQELGYASAKREREQRGSEEKQGKYL